MYLLKATRGENVKFEQIFTDVELLFEKANELISQGFTTTYTRVRS